jgi:hypothetical protein
MSVPRTNKTSKFLSRRVFCLTAVGCVIAATAALVQAQEPAKDSPAKVYVPSETTVAILPVIDRSGEKAENRRRQQAGNGYRNAIEIFVERGFKIADKNAIAKAIEDAGIDLTDEEDYRRDNFYKVGEAVGADLAIFAFIVDTREDTKRNILTGNEIQGRASVKMWLVDVKEKKPIFSAIVREGKAAGQSKLFATDEGRNRRANAVGNAIKEQFEAFLKPYPKVKEVKVSDEGVIEEKG